MHRARLMPESANSQKETVHLMPFFMGNTMGRIRTVKPELLTHEDLYMLEKDTGLPVRLAFVGLFTVCDREGRFKWQPNRIKLAVLPYDELDFSRVLDALATRGFIRMYSVDNEIFGLIPTWGKHQVINNRESASEIPEPEEKDYISMTSTRGSRVLDATATQNNEDGFLSKKPGNVYLALCRASMAFKVGFAEIDPVQRVKDLSAGSPNELEMVEFICADKSLETIIHRALKPFHIRGEWFKANESSALAIDAWFTRAGRVVHAAQGEGKGREGKGIGREGDHAEASPSPAPQKMEVTPVKPKEQPPTNNIWRAYSDAYENRYRAPPVRNAKVNGQLAQLLARLGAEESPAVAAFYVGHNNRYYVNKMHSVDYLLADCEKLRTEWATGNKVTAAAAIEADRLQDAGDMWNRLIDQHEAQGD